jgi:hypothetical protein
MGDGSACARNVRAGARMPTHIPSQTSLRKLTVWQAAYHAAVMETEPNKILDDVRIATEEISKRFQVIFDAPTSEVQAMFDALGTLQFLELAARSRCVSASRKTVASKAIH